MGKYTGITTEIKSNGEKNIMVRFMHNGTRYPIKNFTKLFACKTEKQAFDKLQEVKLLITQGEDPFKISYTTLDDIWEEWIERKKTTKEWSEVTYSNSKYFYNAYIRKQIGMKKITKIDYSDIKLVIDSIINRENGTKNTVKRLLKPLFDDQVHKGNLNNNVLERITTLKEPASKEAIAQRSPEKSLDIIRKLYKAIPLYNKSYKALSIKAMMYMSLLTAHRTGEISKLKKSDVNLETMRVISPSSITKTKVDYHFPLPPELIDYVNALDSNDLLFPIARGSLNAIFDRWVELAKVELFDGKRLSYHDFRRLLAQIMVIECKIDSMLADACLEHQPQGVVKHYFHFSYEDKCNAYTQYWNKIKEGIEK